MFSLVSWHASWDVFLRNKAYVTINYSSHKVETRPLAALGVPYELLKC